MTELINAWVNPLQLLELDEPWPTLGDPEITSEAFLKFLYTPGISSETRDLAARYRQISVERQRLLAVPFEVGIMTHLVWPLRHAKAAYTVGNYLATIALSGIVAEMMALLLWDVFGSPALQRGRRVQKELGRGTFESADQSRRIHALKAAGLISADEVHAYGRIRASRRNHLHLWSDTDDASVAKTAVAMYDDAVYLLGRGLGLGVDNVDNGAVTVKQGVLDYIARAGRALPRDVD